MRRAPGLTALFTAAFAAAGWHAAVSPLGDNSLFWHIRTGRWMLDHGIPRHDVYSFTAPGVSWVSQSWLAELAYGVIDSAFGPFGIRVVMAITGAAIAAVAFRLALDASGGRAGVERVSAVLLAAVAVSASLSNWSSRPLLQGALAFLALVWLVELADSRLGRHVGVGIPVVMWLWANAHGSFALGFAYLGLHLMGRWADGAPPWKGREWVIARAALVAVVACLVNPYGIGILTFPIELLGRGEVLRSVIEWRSPDFRSAQGVTFGAWLSVFIACTALGRNRLSRRDLVVAVPFLMLALWAQRNITVAPLVTLPMAVRAVAGGRSEATDNPRLASERLTGSQGLAHWSIALLLVLLVGSWTATARREPDFDSSSYPVKAMRFLETEDLLGQRMLTEDWSAGYVILRWWPRQKVFIDDRYEMYPLGIISDYEELLRGGKNWRKVLDEHDIGIVVWRAREILPRLMEGDADWVVLYQDRTTVVYARTAL